MIPIKDIFKIISEHTGISENDLKKDSKPYDFPQWNSLANVQIYMSLCRKFKNIGMEEYFDIIDKIKKIIRTIQ